MDNRYVANFLKFPNHAVFDLLSTFFSVVYFLYVQMFLSLPVAVCKFVVCSFDARMVNFVYVDEQKHALSLLQAGAFVFFKTPGQITKRLTKR